MRITYRREGGFAHFPGLSRPLEVDTRAMPAAEAERLEELVTCAVQVAAKRPAPAPGAADRYTYTLSIVVGRRRSTLRVHDPLDAPELKALIDYLEGMREG